MVGIWEGFLCHFYFKIFLNVLNPSIFKNNSTILGKLIFTESFFFGMAETNNYKLWNKNDVLDFIGTVLNIYGVHFFSKEKIIETICFICIFKFVPLVL